NATNPSVLAFIREHGDDRMLCVNNLSKFPQPVELDLSRYAGVSPVECVGGVRFPEIGELPYLLTLPGHGFYWFQLPPERTCEPPSEGHEGVPSYGLPAAGVSTRDAFDTGHRTTATTTSGTQSGGGGGKGYRPL